MLRLFAIVLLFAQTAANPVRPATEMKSSDIQKALDTALAQAPNAPVTDIPLHTVDTGGHNIGVGIVQRLAGARGPAAAHDTVSEVYEVLSGSGTLVTGGTLVDAKRSANAAAGASQVNGPGISGTAIQGGILHHLAKGDMIIIPAGTPHWFSEIQETLTYTIVRVDPNQAIKLK